MGLDMYLFRVNPKYPDFESAMKAEVESGWEDKPDRPLLEVAYWRKCYDISRWFEGRCEKHNYNGDMLSPYYVVTPQITKDFIQWLEDIITNGIYVYREGESRRERINLDLDTYRFVLDEQDVNFDKDYVESRLYPSVSDWELRQVFNSYDDLSSVPLNDETLYYCPSY